jgi:hypothetical protein
VSCNSTSTSHTLSSSSKTPSSIHNLLATTTHHHGAHSTSSGDIVALTSSLLPDTTAGLSGAPNSGTGSVDSTGTSASSSSNSDSENTPPPTPVVVGSVFGSVAGVTLIAFLVLLILRWKRRKAGSLQLGSGRDRDIATPDGPGGNAPTGPMSMIRRASSFVVPSALASLAGGSGGGQPSRSPPTHPSPASDRGFVRVSGRKLPSVLTSGGNGYEDPFADPRLSETSFYHDSRGFYGGMGAVGPSSPTAVSPTSPLAGPPRMPLTTTYAPSMSATPPVVNPPLVRPDALGRSHPSRDGSRNSRFTEDV